MKKLRLQAGTTSLQQAGPVSPQSAGEEEDDDDDDDDEELVDENGEAFRVFRQDSPFPKWALAASIAFGLSPNSASCERVFSMVKDMIGDQQMRALGDYIRAALMLNYNQRVVG